MSEPDKQDDATNDQSQAGDGLTEGSAAAQGQAHLGGSAGSQEADSAGLTGDSASSDGPAVASADSAHSTRSPHSTGSDNLSEADIAQALAGFEEELKDLDVPEDFGGSDLPIAQAGSSAEPEVESASGTDPSFEGDLFENELQGILGDRAKAALLISPLQYPELLCAFCVLADVSALCVGDERGAVAVLKNLEGSAPESAARDLTTVVAGLSLVLAVNRADKLEAHLWMGGQEGTDFSPPLLFMNVARFVEDFMIGSLDLPGLHAQGLTIVDSGIMSRGEALKVIASHTKFKPGGPGPAVVE